MKRSDLKKVLKPLIKECIKEVIFEEGILSGLISEVMKGTSTETASIIVKESPEPMRRPPTMSNAASTKQKLLEVKKKMSKAVGGGAYNGVDLSEGTQPLRKSGSTTRSGATSPLETYAPEDAGIDISSIFSPNWKKLV